MLVAQKIIDVCKTIVAMGDAYVQYDLPETVEAFEKISLKILNKFVEQNNQMVGELTYAEIQTLKSGNPKVDGQGYALSDTKVRVVKDVRQRLGIIDLRVAKELVEKYIRKICNKEI